MEDNLKNVDLTVRSKPDQIKTKETLQVRLNNSVDLHFFSYVD